MEYILLSIIFVAVFAFIAYPIAKPPREENSEPDALDALIAQRDSAYQAIRDLDFDFQLGKLSQADYQSLRDRYKVHAASVLQEIDVMSTAQAERVGLARDGELRCGNCGTPYELGDKFCRKCGNKLGS